MVLIERGNTTMNSPKEVLLQAVTPSAIVQHDLYSLLGVSPCSYYDQPPHERF